MTPDVAVDRLAKILDTKEELEEETLYRAMSDAGIPAPVADRAFKFTQVAWGRVLLDGSGIKFSPDYFCFNGVGDVIESGLLAEQPYFVAAMAAAKRHPIPAGLPTFAIMSADVSAVNSALKAGSKPENLVTAPVALFLEAPTPAGMDRALKVVSERLASPPKIEKPWWRFW